MSGIFSKIIDGLAIWFGCGLSPKAPGTVGTLGALPLYYLLAKFPSHIYAAASVTFIVFSIVVAHFYEAGSSEHDSKEFVMDEVAGYLVTMVMIPSSWVAMAAGFALFRLFDICKPFPISYIDKNIRGGVGTVADDIAAGIAANVVLQALIYYGVQL